MAPVPMEPRCRTIQFYIREGLLPAGGTTSRTQARYTDAHLSRLELISILQAGLGMSVEKIGEFLREAGRGGEARLAMGLGNTSESMHGSRGAARGSEAEGCHGQGCGRIGRNHFARLSRGAYP